MNSNPETMIDIRQEWILPLPFRMTGAALVFIGLYLFIQNTLQLIQSQVFSWLILLGLALALLGILIVSAHYRLRINTAEKRYRLYIWLMGFRQGKAEAYEKIERIFINRVIQGRNVSSYTGHQNEIHEFLYKAFIKLGNGQKIHLDTDKKEGRLLTRVENYRRILSPEFID